MSEIVEGCCKANMSGWKARTLQKKNKRSETPGNKKDRYRCQLTTVGGLPRKAFTAARAYKLKEYPEWIEFTDKLAR